MQKDFTIRASLPIWSLGWLLSILNEEKKQYLGKVLQRLVFLNNTSVTTEKKLRRFSVQKHKDKKCDDG